MRIIAGSARGCSFEAPKGLDTRPTLDRVKEAIFGSIQFEVPGATVLDLFSGSGNMGLEAASRGAKKVYCIDSDPKCASLIRQNAEKLGLSELVTVRCCDFRSAVSELRDNGIQIDIAFLDPPYKLSLGAEAVKELFAGEVLSKNGVLLLEHAWELPPEWEEGPWQITKTKKYGTCGVSVLKWRN